MKRLGDAPFEWNHFCAIVASALRPVVPLMTLFESLLRDAGIATALAERQLILPFKFSFGAPLLLGMIAIAIVLVWPVRVWLLAKLSQLIARSHHDTGLASYAKAVGAIVITTVLVTIGAQMVLATLGSTLTLLPEVSAIARTAAVGVGVIGFGLGIGRALRSPEDKSRRPVHMPPGLGRVIGLYPFAAGIALALNAFIDQTSRVLHATATSTTIAQGIVVFGEAVLIGRFLVLAGRARERQVEAAAATESDAAIPAVFGMTAVAWLMLAVGCVAFILGHSRFALLLLQEMLWAALLLTTAWLLTRFFDALVLRLLDTNRRAGRFATTVVGVRQSRLAQAALLGSITLTIVVWLLAIGLIAAPFHGDGGAVAEQVRPSPLLQSLQSLNISPRSVIMAFVVLFAGIALTRVFRRWMENRFLPSTALDVGARSSILTALTYVGVIIAMLSATNTLGVQLEKITLIASALSVGIGFGLQSIIQNFVSGVILLIERPVKLGDWVAVSGAEGTIRKIRVRATELATADGGISIVPNSALISSTVANRADTLMADRLDLSVTIIGCETARAAHDHLAELVGRSDAVRDQPKPRIHLHTLGDGEWTFDLRVYSRPDASSAQSRSDLLFWLSEQTQGGQMKLKLA
jgi:potassium-dependent mechanosensitive channel